MQDGIPIAYASRSLTDCENRYAHIEKACLFVVLGLQRFDQYTYGRDVTVENNHKPLRTIMGNPLNCAPKRLQAMMMTLHRFSVHIVYTPRSFMIFADIRSCGRQSRLLSLLANLLTLFLARLTMRFLSNVCFQITVLCFVCSHKCPID